MLADGPRLPQAGGDGRSRTTRPGRLLLASGVVLVATLAVAGLLAPWLAPHDPGEQLDPAAGRLRPPGTVLAAVELADGRWLLADRVERTPSGLTIERLGATRRLATAEVRNLTDEGVADRRRFLLGSDRFGRDLASRLLHGARTSLAIGLAALGLALALGVTVGGVAGAAGGAVDRLLMRGVDAFLAFPRIFLILAVAALVPTSPWVVVAVLGGTSWMTLARLVRGQVRSLGRREFVLAARATGQRPWRILTRHLLPNALVPVAVDAALRVGDLILLEASLSFLGLGVQPPTPSWGNMIADGSDLLRAAPWVSTLPGVAIAATVIGFNLLADGLRERLDPRAAGRSGVPGG